MLEAFLDLKCKVSGFSIFLFSSGYFYLIPFLLAFSSTSPIFVVRVVDNGVPAMIPSPSGICCLSDPVPESEEGSHRPGLRWVTPQPHPDPIKEDPGGSWSASHVDRQGGHTVSRTEGAIAS